MDESEFDQFFSKNLEKTQEFDFREDDWEELSGQLALNSSGRNKQGFRDLLWLLALLLLLGTTFWQSYALRLARIELQETRQQIQAMNVAMTSSPIGPCDTVYQTIIEEKIIPVNTDQQKLQQLHNKIAHYEKVLQSISLQNDRRDAQNVPVPIKSNEVSKPVSNTQWTNLPSLPLALFEEKSTVLNFTKPLDLTEDNKELLPPNKKWQLGATANWNTIVCEGCKGNKNGGIGLQVNYRLSNRFRLEARYTFQRMNATFQVNPATYNYWGNKYERDGAFAPNYSVDPLSSIHSEYSYFQLSLGLQYLLGKGFFIGTDLLGYHELQLRNTYNYKDSNAPLGSFQWSTYLDYIKTNLRFELNAGKHFKINKKITIPATLFYQRNIKTDTNHIPPALGIRTGLLFQF